MSAAVGSGTRRRRRQAPSAAPIAATALALSLATWGARDAHACSCMEPELALIGPDRVDDAPTNTRVRVDVPNGSTARLLLRAFGGADVPTAAQQGESTDWTHLVELTPADPLAPGTRYEVVAESPDAHPRFTVVGTFKTGLGPDTTAPVLEAPGRVSVWKNPSANGANCLSPGPWITVEGLRAQDPGRPTATLLYAVWLKKTKADPKSIPSIIRAAPGGTLQIGRSNDCDPHGLTLSKAPNFAMVVAAVDEAGNVSAPKTIRVDLRRARAR